MNRNEFRQKLKIISDREQAFINGDTDDSFFEKLAILGHLDADGYYVLPENIHQAVPPPEGNTPLKDQIFASPLQDKLRLIIQDRFLKSTHLKKAQFVNINYVYSGKLTIHFPDETIVVPEGHICLIGRNIPSTHELPSENDITLSFHINQSYFSKNILYGLSNTGPIMDFLIESYFDKPSLFSYQIFDCSDNDKMKLLFENLFMEYLNPGICSDVLLENYIKIFFIELARSSNFTAHKTQNNVLILEILKYMELNSKNCSLTELAEHFNFNAKYISKLIKQTTGISYSEHLTRMKLADVCNYLKDTQLSIQEIAEKCGYSNRNFFYKKFQEQYGISPKEYRVKYQNNL